MKIRKIAAAVALRLLLAAPRLAFAAGLGEGPLQKILDLLTGNVAHLVGLIVCVGIGYGIWTHRLEWEKIRNFVFGAVFIYGSVEVMAIVSAK